MNVLTKNFLCAVVAYDVSCKTKDFRSEKNIEGRTNFLPKSDLLIDEKISPSPFPQSSGWYSYLLSKSKKRFEYEERLFLKSHSQINGKDNPTNDDKSEKEKVEPELVAK